MNTQELITIVNEKAKNTQLMTEHEEERFQAFTAEVVPTESSSKPNSVASKAHGSVDAAQASQQVVIPNALELSKNQQSKSNSRVETQPEHSSLQHGSDCQTQKPNFPNPSWSQVLKSGLEGEASKTFKGTQIAAEDSSHSFFVHHGDSPGAMLVSQPLTGPVIMKDNWDG